ncbi:MAG: hypothetical protein PVG70_14720 [Desulfobacterales bacterium]|jgi:hypothetical protein
MQTDKKITAAIAAVTHYIQAEEEAQRSQAAMLDVPQAASAPSAGLNPWGLYGRQTQMQLRSLMQLRTFQRRL